MLPFASTTHIQNLTVVPRRRRRRRLIDRDKTRHCARRNLSDKICVALTDRFEDKIMLDIAGVFSPSVDSDEIKKNSCSNCTAAGGVAQELSMVGLRAYERYVWK